ncbi:MAG: ribonuclease HIII [Parachlamydiales bacterium]|jgi:ribonuclease HIII
MSKKSSFTTKIDPKLKDRLLEDLRQQGFQIATPPYTFFSARKPGLTCTFYESGSLVVQGGKIQEFLEFYLEPEILHDLAFTHPEIKLDPEPRIGVDEAGKGDFFGPLCVVAVYSDKAGLDNLVKIGVQDSKKLSDSSIVKMAQRLKKETVFSPLILYPKTYNDLYQRFQNLNRLLAWGHATVIENLVKKTGCRKALIDQFASENVLENALKSKKLQIDLTQRTKAEADPVVAAASILARFFFLEGLEKLREEFGVLLPKGASAEVIKAGRKIVLQKGPEILPMISKIHFKTYREVCPAD